MSSTITIRSRCHEATGTWVPEPGSPKFMRDLSAARERAERKTTNTSVTSARWGGRNNK